MYNSQLKNKSDSCFKDELNTNIEFYSKIIKEENEKYFLEHNFNDEYMVNSCDYNLAKNLLDALLHIKVGLVANPNIIKAFINPKTAISCINENIEFYSKKIKGDKTQAMAVSMACGMKDILIIQGPPGTGKTTTILEIIAQIKKKNKNSKILITSGTHVAVDNVIERIIKSKHSKDEYTNLKLYDDVLRARQIEDEPNEKSLVNMFDYSEERVFKDLLNNTNSKTKNIIQQYDYEKIEENNYYNAILSKFRSNIILKKGIIGVTINALNSCRFDENVAFDYVIVDEVGKSNFAEIMFAARFAKKLILIGDPKQLPCDIQYTFNNEDDTKKYMEKLNEVPFINYLFENINKGCFLFLNKQYRMVKEIGSYISDAFYNGDKKLENGRLDSNGDGLNYIDYNYKECSILNAPLLNKLEVEIIKQLILVKLKNVSKDKIAVITPYKEQMRYIRKVLINIIPKNNINTVDAFQGQENDVVIFSCVRNTGKPTNFFKKDNRINVAISRAKNQIWVIGASNYLKNVDCLDKYINYKVTSDVNLKCNNYVYSNEQIFEKR